MNMSGQESDPSMYKAFDKMIIPAMEYGKYVRCITTLDSSAFWSQLFNAML